MSLFKSKSLKEELEITKKVANAYKNQIDELKQQNAQQQAQMKQYEREMYEGKLSYLSNALNSYTDEIDYPAIYENTFDQVQKSCKNLMNEADKAMKKAHIATFDSGAYNPQGIQLQRSIFRPVVDYWYSALQGTHGFGQGEDVNTLLAFFNSKRQFPLNTYSIYLQKFYQQNSIIQSIITSITMPLSNNISCGLTDDIKQQVLNNIKKDIFTILNYCELLGGCYVCYNKKYKCLDVLTREQISMTYEGITTKDAENTFFSEEMNRLLESSYEERQEIINKSNYILNNVKFYKRLSGKQKTVLIPTEYSIHDVFFVRGFNKFYYFPMSIAMNGFGASLFEGCFDTALSLLHLNKFANMLSRVNGKFNIVKQKQKTDSKITGFNRSTILNETLDTKYKILSGDNTQNILALEEALELQNIDNNSYRENIESQIYNAIIGIYGIPELFISDNDSGNFKLFKKNKTNISAFIRTICETRFYHYKKVLENILGTILIQGYGLSADKAQIELSLTISQNAENNKQLLSYNAVANQEDSNIVEHLVDKII